MRFTGKKSELSGLKKVIGQASADERAEVGQLVQALDKEIVDTIQAAETRLRHRIGLLRTEREAST